MSTIDNYDRAFWADKAISAFRRACRGDMDMALGDLLCDLRHWADLHGENFERINRNAKAMYQTEVREDGGKCLPEAQAEGWDGPSSESVKP